MTARWRRRRRRAPEPPADNATRENLRRLLRDGQARRQEVEIDTADAPPSFVDVFSGTGHGGDGAEPARHVRRRARGARSAAGCRCPRRWSVLTDEEADKLIDLERLQQGRDPPRRAGRHHLHRRDRQGRRARSGRPRPRRLARGRAARPAADRRGLDGHDEVRAGARPTTCCSSPPARSTSRKPKDLIPELQGRFPIRVELERCRDEDFVRILTEPENALTRQYTALLATEEVTLDIRADAVAEIARIAHAGERAHGEHRRAAAAHDHGARCSTTWPSRRPSSGRRRSRSPPPTCASAWTGSSRTRTSRSTSSRNEKGRLLRAALAMTGGSVEPLAGRSTRPRVTSCCRARGPGPCAPASVRGGRRRARPCWGRATRRPSSCRRRRRGRRPWTGRGRRAGARRAVRVAAAHRRRRPPPVPGGIRPARRRAGRRHAAGRHSARRLAGRQSTLAGRRAAVSRRRVAARGRATPARAPGRARARRRRPSPAAPGRRRRSRPARPAAVPAGERGPAGPGAGAAPAPCQPWLPAPPGIAGGGAVAGAGPAVAPRQPPPGGGAEARRRTQAPRHRASRPRAAERSRSWRRAAGSRRPEAASRRHRASHPPGAARAVVACRASCVCAGCERQTVRRGLRLAAPGGRRRAPVAAVAVLAVAVVALPVAAVVDRAAVDVDVAGRDVGVADALGNPVAAAPGPVVAGPVPVAVDPHVAVSGRRRPVLRDRLGRERGRIHCGVVATAVDVHAAAHRDRGGPRPHDAARREGCQARASKRDQPTNGCVSSALSWRLDGSAYP